MKLFSVAALLTAVASTANALLVNTPVNVVQCQPLLITWDPQGSSGPFTLSIQPGNDPSGAALLSWENLTGTSFTWVVTISSGTSIGLLLRDTTGATSQSAPFTIQAGSSTDCSASSSVGTPAGSSSSTVSGSGSTLISVSSIPPVTRTSTTTPITTTTTSTRPLSSLSTPTSVRSSTTTTSSPASTSTGSSGGALSNAVNFGSAGFLAALVGAVLA